MPFSVTTLNRALTHLQTNPMKDIMFRELAGSNVPHALFVRNLDEMLDQSVTQFGNTAAFFGSGHLLDKGIDKLSRWINTPHLTAAQTGWLHLGKSMTIFSVIASLLVASPFLRNFVTARRLGTTDFTQIVGERERDVDPKARADAHIAGQRFLRIAGRIIGGGAAIALGMLALTQLAIRRNANFGTVPQFLLKHLGLEKGRFNNLAGLPSFLFWVIPTYAGFTLASRDKFEYKEILLRFAAFNAAFFLLPSAVMKSLQHVFKDRPVKGITPNNVAYIGKFVSSIVFCSLLPTLVNIYLTQNASRMPK